MNDGNFQAAPGPARKILSKTERLKSILLCDTRNPFQLIRCMPKVHQLEVQGSRRLEVKLLYK